LKSERIALFSAGWVIIAHYKVYLIIMIQYNWELRKWVPPDPDCVYINPQAFIFRNRVFRETPNSLAVLVLFHRF